MYTVHDEPHSFVSIDTCKRGDSSFSCQHTPDVQAETR